MNMPVFVAIALLGFCVCGLTNGDDVLVVKADPSEVTDNVTKGMSVDCRPSRSHQESGNFGLMLVIFRSDDSGTENFLARQAVETSVVEENRTSAEGHMRRPGDKKTTFLTLSVKKPTFSEEGVYVCRYAFMDKMFKIHQAEASINVTVVEPPPVVVPEVQADEDEVTTCQCDHIMKEIQDLKDNLVAENQKLKVEIRKFNESCRVSFSAKFSKESRPIQSEGLVPFNDVITNNGGAFQTDKSAFVAPCTGQYFFSLTLRSNQKLDSGYVDGLIMVGDDEVARTSVFIDAPINNYQSATNGAVVSLSQGQEVSVKIKTTSFGKLRGSTYSVFSGFYLHP